MKHERIGGLSLATIVVLCILPLLTILAALALGRVALSPEAVLSSLLQKLGLPIGSPPDTQTQLVLWNLRFPRILLAFLVGAGLSAAGCAFQSLFANPLATPDTLGVASGASFGAVMALLLGISFLGVQLFSLAAGLVAVALTWVAGSGKNRSVNSMVLSGIMIGSLFSALISLVKYLADTESQLPSITYWLMGGMDSAGYNTLKLGAPPILVGLVLLWILRWRMNILPLSDDEAKAVGVNLRLLRFVIILAATAITASCVSMCGQVGWVGLLVPHLCRMRFGSNHRALLPACISLGGVFLMVVDTLARTVSPSEIPISVLTALIGAPFFIFLLRKTGGWKL